MPPKPRSVEERFWPKVDKNGPTPAHHLELGPCWIWTAGKNRAGYGRLNVGGRKGGAHLAPRVVWEMERGPIPPDLCVLHHCDNPPCVRPSHLFLGTQGENQADMMAKGRHRPTSAFGVRVGTAKLTDDAVREILRLHTEGMTQKELAARFHVHQTTISIVILRKWWRHVE